MKRTSLVAMLTLLATIAATLAVAGCGRKATSGSQTTPTNGATTSTTTTGTHKQPSRAPAY
jgi:hypothetical protein